MLATQESWRDGMAVLLERYKKETEKKLNKLGNDHDTDIICKTIINTIEFIQEIPYGLNAEKKSKKKQEVW